MKQIAYNDRLDIAPFPFMKKNKKKGGKGNEEKSLKKN